MPIGTAGAIAIGLAVAAGFGAGWGLRPVPDTADVMAEQTAAIEVLGDSLATVAEAAGRPIVLDAETRASLAEIPPQCVTVLGGDPMSAACGWASCIRYGVQSAQRPECRAIEAAMLSEAAGCPVATQAPANATETPR